MRRSPGVFIARNECSRFREMSVHGGELSVHARRNTHFEREALRTAFVVQSRLCSEGHCGDAKLQQARCASIVELSASDPPNPRYDDTQARDSWQLETVRTVQLNGTTCQTFVTTPSMVVAGRSH